MNCKQLSKMSRQAVTLCSLILFLSLPSLAQDKFTKEGFYQYMVEQGIRYPKIVYAQAVLESGGFTSAIFRENNNLFGMRMPVRRETTAIGVKRKYAVFKSWKSAVEDYAMFQRRYMSKYQTEASYLAYLNRNYCECKDYVAKLRDKYPKFSTL